MAVFDWQYTIKIMNVMRIMNAIKTEKKPSSIQKYFVDDSVSK